MCPDVSVLIVSYNSSGQLSSCLHSVFTTTRSLAVEVIVVDNGSTDESVALIRREFPQVRLLLPGRNLGFAAGVNLAARQASGRSLLLLNPDTIVLGGSIAALVNFARRRPGHGLYGGRTLKPNGTVEPSSCWGLPSLWSLAMFATGLSSLARQHPWFDPESLGRWPRDTVREVGLISGCCLLVPRPVWDELGGFDERFFMYGEDADLALRARRAGYRPVLCPDAQVVHEVGRSSTPAAKLFLLYRGKATLLRTHWHGAARVLGLALLVTGVALRAGGARLASLGRRRPGIERWATIWHQRRSWISGYPPVALTTLPSASASLPS